jgi:hypothetical protein
MSPNPYTIEAGIPVTIGFSLYPPLERSSFKGVAVAGIIFARGSVWVGCPFPWFDPVLYCNEPGEATTPSAMAVRIE